jgi:uncharacterized ferritin-like protein (DUF455 family)
MSATAFVDELEVYKNALLAPIIAAGATSVDGATTKEPRALLQVALANEIAVSELAAAWMPTTPEIDVKLAFARQAGDEAGHFQLVAERLAEHGFDLASYAPPAASPLFAYLRELPSTVERIAAGLFTLESLAYSVNEAFMAFCEARGDAETVRIYRDYIQPDERAHQLLGQHLLAKYAVTAEQQQLARATVTRLLEIAASTRAAAAARLGIACLPGC